MAQPGAFPDGMQCLAAAANWRPKYGRSRSQQTYHYSQRHYHFVPGTGLPHQSEQLKAQAARYSPAGTSLLKSIIAAPNAGKGLLNQIGNLTR